MKQILIIYVASIFSTGVNGRTISEKINLVNKNYKYVSAETRFDLQGNNMVFSRLSAKPTDIYVLDSKGNTEFSGTVSASNNAVNVSKLSPGNHTIVMKEGSDIKMFGYYSAIVVTAKR